MCTCSYGYEQDDIKNFLIKRKFFVEYREKSYNILYMLKNIDKGESMNILVSACLLGLNCRYDGKGQPEQKVLDLIEKYNLIPVCPEVYGGLKTPRKPAEIKEGKVVTVLGEDVTENFLRGARETLKIAELFKCPYAILKERSPSCGFGRVYDGTFSGKIIFGNGITADLLDKKGIKVFNENTFEKFLAEIEK
jgi:uncharacterized protein YbbK (DUF523 family)